LRESSFFKPILLFISVLTLLIAGIGANYETDLKKIIALSTLSQLGVIIISLGLGIPYLALFHLYTHALFKALLFLCAGTIIHNNSNNQDVRLIGIMFKQAPLTIAAINVANLSLCGAPFLSGFYSKDLILEISLFEPCNLLIVLLIFLATGITAAYSLRLSFCSLWAEPKNIPLHSKQEKDYYINVSTFVLSVAAVVAGFMFQNLFLQFSPQPFILPQFLKFLTIIVILGGLIVAAGLWDTDFFPKKILKIDTFFSTMWFLAIISAQPATKFSIIIGTNIIKSIDQGWLEILGGQGTIKVSSDIANINQRLQAKTFNFIILIIIFSLCIIIFLMR